MPEPKPAFASARPVEDAPRLAGLRIMAWLLATSLIGCAQLQIDPVGDRPGPLPGGRIVASPSAIPTQVEIESATVADLVTEGAVIGFLVPTFYACAGNGCALVSILAPLGALAGATYGLFQADADSGMHASEVQAHIASIDLNTRLVERLVERLRVLGVDAVAGGIGFRHETAIESEIRVGVESVRGFRASLEPYTGLSLRARATWTGSGQTSTFGVHSAASEHLTLRDRLADGGRDLGLHIDGLLDRLAQEMASAWTPADAAASPADRRP